MEEHEQGTGEWVERRTQQQGRGCKAISNIQSRHYVDDAPFYFPTPQTAGGWIDRMHVFITRTIWGYRCWAFRRGSAVRTAVVRKPTVENITYPSII